jgi:hypothetical protein
MSTVTARARGEHVTGALRSAAARVVRPRRSPVPCDVPVPSPRTMDPDEDDDFARTFAEACET